MQVTLKKIVSMLNSRSLGFIHNNDLEQILSLNHLLFGRKLYSSNIDNIEPNDSGTCAAKRMNIYEHVSSLREN